MDVFLGFPKGFEFLEVVEVGFGFSIGFGRGFLWGFELVGVSEDILGFLMDVAR